MFFSISADDRHPPKVASYPGPYTRALRAEVEAHSARVKGPGDEATPIFTSL